VNCGVDLLWGCGGRLGVLDCESWSTKTTYSDLYIHAQVLWCLDTYGMQMVNELVVYCPADWPVWSLADILAGDLVMIRLSY
jgi:hypothetical protein